MTSKLRRTIVGVGIALGGAAPGCFGRTDLGDHSRGSDGDDDSTIERPTNDAWPSDRAVSDGGPPNDAVSRDTGSPAVDARSDASPDVDGGALDASSDGADPFCDVWWPPTKGNDFSGFVPCVDPLGECTRSPVPYQCFRMTAPFTCDYFDRRVPPLYCIGGEWQCPPGSDPGTRCLCWGSLEPGQTCTDAGLVDASSGADDDAEFPEGEGAESAN